MSIEQLLDRAGYLRRTGRTEEARVLRQQAQQLPSRVLDDPDYRRLKYIRYADDFLLGFVGTASRSRRRSSSNLPTFCKTQLRLELSDDKTLITHARSAAARFLGYDVTVMQDNRKHTNGRRSRQRRRQPAGATRRHSGEVSAIHEARRCRRIARELIHQSAFDIVTQYQSVYRGIVELLSDGAQPSRRGPSSRNHAALAHADAGGQTPHQRARGVPALSRPDSRMKMAHGEPDSKSGSNAKASLHWSLNGVGFRSHGASTPRLTIDSFRFGSPTRRRSCNDSSRRRANCAAAGTASRCITFARSKT